MKNNLLWKRKKERESVMERESEGQDAGVEAIKGTGFSMGGKLGLATL